MERATYAGANLNSLENGDDPLTHLESKSKVNPEFLSFVREGYKHGLTWFRNSEIPTLEQLFQEFKFRIFVTRHELGHYYVAKSFGWQILEFVTDGVGKVKGWVKMRLPQKPLATLKAENAAIAAAGYAATGETRGCGADFNSISSDLSVSRVVSIAKQRIPSSSTLESQARSWVFAKLGA